LVAILESHGRSSRRPPNPGNARHARIRVSWRASSADYNYDRIHHGRLTGGRIPADIVYGARKMEAR
jgi:hypothetical protein